MGKINKFVTMKMKKAEDKECEPAGEEKIGDSHVVEEDEEEVQEAEENAQNYDVKMKKVRKETREKRRRS